MFHLSWEAGNTYNIVIGIGPNRLKQTHTDMHYASMQYAQLEHDDDD